MLVAHGTPRGLVVRGTSETVPLDDVFVAIDLDDEVAHIACDGGDGIRWKAIPRADGELIVRLGAGAPVRLRTEVTPYLGGRTRLDSEGGVS